MTKTEKKAPEGSLAATEKTQKGSLPETADGAYAHFLAEAMALPEDEISPYRIDAALAVYNARTGIAAVSKQLDALRAYNLPVNGIVDFSALLLAFGHAVARAEAESGSDKTLAKKLARNWELRALLLAALEFGTAAKLIDRKHLVYIKQGRGPVDSAQDVSDLAVLMERPELKGQFPQVTAEILEEAKLLSAELLALLRPNTAKKGARKTESHATALEIRNRFAELVVRRHDWLWRCGAVLFGRDVDRHVPGLRANRATTASEPEPTEPEPTP